MAKNPACTIYIGNLDEKVSERVLYEILIQVGRVVDLHIPRDKETNRHKGFAFAEYETEETADYAIKLFSGLVRLHNKTLKFGMSGQDKSYTSQSNGKSSTSQSNGKSSTCQSNGTPVTPKLNPLPIPKPYPVQTQGTMSHVSAQPIANFRVPSGTPSVSPLYPQVSPDGLLSRGPSNNSFEYSRRLFGSMLNNVSRPGARQPIAYPSY